MYKSLIALLGAILFLLSTPAFAQMPNPCGPSEDDEACFTRLKVLVPDLMRISDELQGRVDSLEREQTAAISTGDTSEIARLRRELQSVTAERDEALAALEAANARIGELERELGTLSGRVDELEALVTQFLEAEATKPVVEVEEAPEPTQPIDPPHVTPQLASYQPTLDPSVYGRMAWRDGNPSFPSPIVHPDIRWENAGNCQSFRNISSVADEAPFVFVDVENVDFAVDGSGYTMSEVLLGPGQRVSWCSSGDATISLTPARESTASSSERHWDGRRWVSVERSRHSCNGMRLRSGKDGSYRRSCSASW